MQRLTVDRIEEDYAICEKDDGKMLNISLEKLPKDIKEGSIVIIDDDGKITLDKIAEKERKTELFNLQNSIFDK